MPLIPISLLHPHPHNANRMSEAFMHKLTMHIKQQGEYPPIIVRQHPTTADAYQILDGHHRAKVLQRLGFSEAQCEIWKVSDERASILLLTLNRLHGEDDPQLRGELLSQLTQSIEIDALTKLLPDDAEQITKLIALSQPPPEPSVPPMLDEMPMAITFFMKKVERERLEQKLDAMGNDRTEALLQLAGVSGP